MSFALGTIFGVVLIFGIEFFLIWFYAEFCKPDRHRPKYTPKYNTYMDYRDDMDRSYDEGYHNGFTNGWEKHKKEAEYTDDNEEPENKEEQA